MTTQWPVRLEIKRHLAPHDKWHWCVVFNGGHIYSVSETFESAEACIVNAAGAGLDALYRAEMCLTPLAFGGLRRQEKAMDIQLGRELFMFDGFNHWCDTAKEKFIAANTTSDKVLCIDRFGRVCALGSHFMKAAEDGAYPVRVYLLRDDMAETPNTAVTGAAKAD